MVVVGGRLLWSFLFPGVEQIRIPREDAMVGRWRGLCGKKYFASGKQDRPSEGKR